MLGNEMFKFPEGVVSRWAELLRIQVEQRRGRKGKNGRKGAALVYVESR